MTKFYFFSGKGGVGKTIMACAGAVYLAGLGKKTLIITTDPASNLADVFEQPIGHQITQVAGMEYLFAMELDPDIATSEYKERTLSPLRGLIPVDSYKVLEEQLNSPCTAEMATFDRFTDFLQEPEFDVVIFDTAPTGHTLRLLELPVEWSNVIEKAAKDESGGQTCIGPAAALAKSKEKFDRAISTMRDSRKTAFVFVLRPETTPIYEVKRSIAELKKIAIPTQELIINGIYPKSAYDNPFMLGRFAKQQEFLAQIKKEFSLPAILIELEAQEIKGKDALLEIGKKIYLNSLRLSDYQTEVIKITGSPSNYNYPSVTPEIKNLITPLNGDRRVTFFTGKGGVGKSSVAAATALWISDIGYKTLLLTTDPASHLSQILQTRVSSKPLPVDGEKNLWLAQINAEESTAEYKEKILSEAKQKYDEQRLLAIEEELNSPCTEEMAVFEKFIEFLTLKDFEVIVFDTAPTGHTLRLLELPVQWSKQLEIKTFITTGETEIDKITKSRFKEVIDIMQDTTKTTFAFVMYPESTPIEEATRSMKELSTMNVPTSLVVANFILPAAIVTNDYLKQRKAMQEKYLNEMDRRFTAPIIRLPLLAEDLVGKEKLREAGYLLYGK